MSPGIRNILRYSFLTAIAVLVVLAVGTATRESAMNSAGGGKRVPAVKFSHPNHVTGRGIECADCHAKAMESTLSSDVLMPDHTSCESCHSESIESDCGYCHLNPDEPGPSVTPVRELIFAHETHAAKGGISCVTCHGSILGDADESGDEDDGADMEDDDQEDDAAEGFSTEVWASGEHLPGMATCVTCHSDKGVSNNCETCHSDLVTLIPENHLASGFFKEHRRAVRAGEMDVSCQTCHQESFCQDCHTGHELRSFGAPGGLMSTPGARTALRDTPKELRLQATHELNYRFTHGIDARSRIVDCASCHDRQSFCADCHQAGGNVLQGAIKPQSHMEAGFVTIGAGSGGGRHAEMGRRDIESCMSCHDVEGTDPTCALCHSGG